jgi:hypothetical protein
VQATDCATQRDRRHWNSTTQYQEDRTTEHEVQTVAALRSVRRKSYGRQHTPRIHKAVHWQPELQHTVTRSAAAWPSHRLCYRPAVFVRLPRLIALSLPQRKIRCAL